MSSSKKLSVPISRTVALCYIRQSYTRNASDQDSPERQRANIEAACAQKGWTLEWYADAEKHKSGTSEKNRPGWLALKRRLGDPDVVALVANDLSRLHRKSWRVGDLVDFIQAHGVELVLAAPGRQVDTSTPMGQMFIMLASIFDEYYAKDLSIRQKDSIAHRKREGKVINLPFGTRRRQDGYLEPSEDGAWWMPNGKHIAGSSAAPPDEAAVWRGYYACAERILRLYIENDFGWELLAYRMNMEGWAFRDRRGDPRALDKDDVRRVVRAWPEYGGLVLDKSAKKRHAHDVKLHETPLHPERAVFDLDLSLLKNEAA